MEMVLELFGGDKFESAVMGWIADNEETVNSGYHKALTFMFPFNLSGMNFSSGSTPPIAVQGCNVTLNYHAAEDLVLKDSGKTAASIDIHKLEMKTSYPVGIAAQYSDVWPSLQLTGDMILEAEVDEQCTNPAITQLDGLSTTTTLDFEISYTSVSSATIIMLSQEGMCPTPTLTGFNHGGSQTVVDIKTLDVTIGDVRIPLGVAAESFEGKIAKLTNVAVPKMYDVVVTPLMNVAWARISEAFCNKTCEAICENSGAGAARLPLFASTPAPGAKSGIRDRDTILDKIQNRDCVRNCDRGLDIGPGIVPLWITRMVKASGLFAGAAFLVAGKTYKETIEKNLKCTCE